MIRVVLQLALELGRRADLDHGTRRVRVCFISNNAIDLWILLLEATQHVVKGAVFHHQNNKMLQIAERGAHETSQVSPEIGELFR